MDYPSLIGLFRTSSPARRSIAATVLVVFAMFVLQPAAYAARQADEVLAGITAGDEQSPAARLNAVLDRVERHMEAMERAGGVDEAGAAEGPSVQAAPQAAPQAELAELRRALKAAHQKVMADFEALGKRLEGKDLPDVIYQRHEDAVAQYEERYQGMMARLKRAERGETAGQRAEAAREALEYLKKYQDKPDREPFDPNKLPSRELRKETPTPPKETEDAYDQAGLYDRPLVRLATHGEFRVDELAGASDPRWLEATTEVTLTEPIKQKAAELDHDPVKIHAWVRNNVQWIPSWGATQTAEHTLSSRRGNAMDIASLEIALLRASDIPARYVHGTIDVPADEFKNWAGGFEDIEAATDYAASGGIPLTSRIEGGQVKTVRMEHVWVEAAVDYFPSRAAVNKSADAWIPLDASFKQYTFKEGLNFREIAGFDPEAIAQDFTESGTINDSKGFVQGLDTAILQNAQQSVENNLKAFIDNDLADDATVADVIGGRIVRAREFETLPASIPNAVVATGMRTDALPDQLQHKITFGLGTDVTGRLQNTVSFPLAAVNSKRVTLSFSPASEADQDAFEALLPESDIDDPSELPASISAQLINVVPELRVGGEVVASGDGMSLGQEMDFGFRVTQLGFGAEIDTKRVAAGSYLSVAVAGGSVSPARLEGLSRKINRTSEVLESGSDQQLASLTRDEVVGDLFHAGSLGYFAQLSSLQVLQARQADAQVNLAPSAGTYGYIPDVTTLFGVPNEITPGGVSMDLDRIARIVSTPQDPNVSRAALNVQIGALSSALEHGVPEQQFSTENEQAEGISAAKALDIASMSGQRLYTIDQDNRDQALQALNLSDTVRSDIRSAVNAGMVVTTHTNPVSIPGWQGAGYVVLDPKTGSGGWLIEGGLNGGFVENTRNFSKALTFSVAEFVEPFSKLTAISKFIGGSLLFIGDILSTVFFSDLNVSQKVATILINLTAAIVTSHLVSLALATFIFTAPVGAILLAALIMIVVSLIQKLITLIVQDLLAYRFRELNVRHSRV